MKYCVLIIDGAAGRPLAKRGGKTSLELAYTPNLDAMAQEGTVGLVRTVPVGMTPDSACACMSLLGYDPGRYQIGRAAIEARNMGISIDEDEVVFRCNLVSVHDGRMRDYSAGHISSSESGELISALEEGLGSRGVHFYPGVGYRHICKVKGREDTLEASCTPPHNIPDRLIKEFLPKGPGSGLLRDLMQRSEAILRDHPVNVKRRSRGSLPASMIWLFWGSRRVPDIPAFRQVYGLDAAVTSGVDVIQGMARVMGMGVLDIAGVTDGMDTDFSAQGVGALAALNQYDLVVVHIEAPDEAGHAGSVGDKVTAIQRVDAEMVAQLRSWRGEPLRVLVTPDHPTPIELRTHTPEPVPFILWGQGLSANGAGRLTEAEAVKTGLFLDPGYNIMGRLIGIQSGVS
ncbi:MAG: cofactor-independent phosphoglycerate mutase [Dehalococcoidales bacterium]|nr:cofactor-independent phosphoglycerate mutase [Dehalococcoidales bacterium]